MPNFEWDGLSFHYRSEGEGISFIFQHGLGGDVSQPFGLFSPPPGFRLLAFDCRGHGETRPLGDPERITLASFADDLRAFMVHLGLSRAIVGGISMGAAVALDFVVRYPGCVVGLILSRPAWLDCPTKANVEIYGQIARLIRQYGASRGCEIFRQTELYADLLRHAPDAANSLLGQFGQPRAEETVVKLERIPKDTPRADRQAWAAIAVPTLVLASRQDPIHPFEYGEILAGAIPRAEFCELTSKSVSRNQHAADVQRSIEAFLTRQFSAERLIQC